MEAIETAESPAPPGTDSFSSNRDPDPNQPPRPEPTPPDPNQPRRPDRPDDGEITPTRIGLVWRINHPEPPRRSSRQTIPETLPKTFCSRQLTGKSRVNVLGSVSGTVTLNLQKSLLTTCPWIAPGLQIIFMFHPIGSILFAWGVPLLMKSVFFNSRLLLWLDLIIQVWLSRPVPGA